MSTHKFRSMLLVVLLLWGIAVHGQDPTNPVGEWVLVGAGISGPDTWTSVTGSYGRIIAQRPWQLTIDYTERFTLGAVGDRGTCLGVTTGWRALRPYGVVSVLGGPGLLLFTDVSRGPSGALQERASAMIGLVGSIHGVVKPLWFVLPEVGVGVELIGVVNPLVTYGGFRLSLLFHNGL